MKITPKLHFFLKFFQKKVENIKRRYIFAPFLRSI